MKDRMFKGSKPNQPAAPTVRKAMDANVGSRDNSKNEALHKLSHAPKYGKSKHGR